MSVFDAGARPIMKGKLKAPAEFGVKLLVQDCENKIITRYQVFEGSPNDDTLLLVPAVDVHIALFGRAPIRCYLPWFCQP